MTPRWVDFLKACVQARLNIVISGGTSTGKTTLLNVLSSFLPEHERIVTIEDAAELQLNRSTWCAWKPRPPNVEGRGEVTIRQLVINALRMRPDRIVVGEVRGGEALDMLQAMNTGHDGSLTTAHSNSPRDTLHRIETMVLMAGMDLPLKADPRADRLGLRPYRPPGPPGRRHRKVVQITEVQGMEGDVIVMQDIFRFVQTGVKNGVVEGYFTATGVRPKFMDKIEAMALGPAAGRGPDLRPAQHRPLRPTVAAMERYGDRLILVKASGDTSSLDEVRRWTEARRPWARAGRFCWWWTTCRRSLSTGPPCSRRPRSPPFWPRA
jgi:pilus assembly protein CpaF